MKLAIDSLDTPPASLAGLQSPLDRGASVIKSSLAQLVNAIVKFMRDYSHNTGTDFEFVDSSDVNSDYGIQKHYPKHLWTRHSALLVEAKKCSEYHKEQAAVVADSSETKTVHKQGSISLHVTKVADLPVWASHLDDVGVITKQY